MRFILSTIFFLFLSTAFGQNTLTVSFKGIKEVKGFLMLALKDTKNERVKEARVPVTKSGTVVYQFTDIPPGSYAIAVFHDANGDKELNTNFAGIPKELYGFSNDARGAFGPPSIADQLFKVDKSTALSITLK